MPIDRSNSRDPLNRHTGTHLLKLLVGAEGVYCYPSDRSRKMLLLNSVGMALMTLGESKDEQSLLTSGTTQVDVASAIVGL